MYNKKTALVKNYYNEEEQKEGKEEDVMEEEKLVKDSNEFSIKVEN